MNDNISKSARTPAVMYGVLIVSVIVGVCTSAGWIKAESERRQLLDKIRMLEIQVLAEQDKFEITKRAFEDLAKQIKAKEPDHR
jgi:hypothetical protein